MQKIQLFETKKYGVSQPALNSSQLKVIVSDLSEKIGQLKI